MSKTGFEVVQVEPAPENGTHKLMPIHYLAIEAGVHTLPDGTSLEAGRKSTRKQKHGSGVVGNQGWATISFSDIQPPVITAQEFAYDSNGNRTGLTEDNGALQSYTYGSGNNRLLSITGPTTITYSYDAAGNVINDGTHSYGYDDRGRLVSVDTGAAFYEHNGQGQRVRKDNGVVTLFVFDEAGQLIGEYDESGVPINEHVFFSGAPVAVLRGTEANFVHTDHLGTPRVITNGSNVIWRWESDSFGSTAADEDPDGDSSTFEYNLRYPGQYRDDETGLHYNYFRTYDPSTGRYLESDPIGLGGGLNSYGYTQQNPINSADPTGLLDLKRLIECTIGSEGINKQGCFDELSGQAKKDFADTAKELAAEAADNVEQCATCITVCTFKGFIGATPEEMLVNFGTQTAVRQTSAHLDLLGKGAGTAVRGLFNRVTGVIGLLQTIECTLKCE